MTESLQCYINNNGNRGREDRPIKWSGREKGLWTSKRDVCVGPCQSSWFMCLSGSCISLTTLRYNFLSLLLHLCQSGSYAGHYKIIPNSTSCLSSGKMLPNNCIRSVFMWKYSVTSKLENRHKQYIQGRLFQENWDEIDLNKNYILSEKMEVERLRKEKKKNRKKKQVLQLTFWSKGGSLSLCDTEHQLKSANVQMLWVDLQQHYWRKLACLPTAYHSVANKIVKNSALNEDIFFFYSTASPHWIQSVFFTFPKMLNHHCFNSTTESMLHVAILRIFIYINVCYIYHQLR